MELYNSPLHVKEIFGRWLSQERNSGFGAYIPFVGIVREEHGIEALSFDIYEPVLRNWFQAWEAKAAQDGAVVKMAHAIGDVPIGSTSYMSAVFSKGRKVALALIEDFVEDFKASAPIWKYDVIDGKRIYARERSMPMRGAGILKDIDEGIQAK